MKKFSTLLFLNAIVLSLSFAWPTALSALHAAPNGTHFSHLKLDKKSIDDNLSLSAADVSKFFISSNTSGTVGLLNVDDMGSLDFSTFMTTAQDADGIYYDFENDVLYQLNRTDNVINAYSKVRENLDQGMMPELTATSSSDFINGREIAVRGNRLVVAQDASDANGQTDAFVIYTIAPDQITYSRTIMSPINLWGIQFVGSDLYAIRDNSSNVVVFDNFLGQHNWATISQEITVEGMIRTHGLTVNEDLDMMILTDVGSGADPDDGAFFVVSNYSEAIADNQITMDEAVRVGGDQTELGNPVDVAYDFENNMIYIAERANEGGKVLGFELPMSSGNVAPDFKMIFEGASAIVHSDLMNNNVEFETVAHVFASSNTSGEVGLLGIDELGMLNFSTFMTNAMDADGIHYDADNDVLYQLNRTDNVINAYSNVRANLEMGMLPELTATSSSNFINGREIAVRGHQLVVAQDASDANGQTNAFVIYSVSPDEITYEKTLASPINLWGIQFVGADLYAIQDNSRNLVVFGDFLGQSGKSAVPSQLVGVEDMVRTHGLTVIQELDMMILTDVGSGADPDDGALFVVAGYSSAISDGQITSNEFVRVAGDKTELGNPVDVAYDAANKMMYIAERANEGGKILGFSAPDSSGNFSPDYKMLFPGASAIVISDLMNNVVDFEALAHFFTSSNTSGEIGVHHILEDGSIERTFFSGPMDADGIYYNEMWDVLYQLDRTNNVVVAYSDVMDSLQSGGPLMVSATSSSDFINGREIAVYGNQLIVTQDANDANGQINKLLVYTLAPGEISLAKEHEVDFNLWGIHMGSNNLYAIKDNTNEIAIIYDFLSQPDGAISNYNTISIEGLVRTHGITYDAVSDKMILTDVGDAASPTDGAVVIVDQFYNKSQDGMITMDEQIRIAGDATNLGNPVDVAYYPAGGWIIVAERANDGGRILGFGMPLTSGEYAPAYDRLEAGVSAIYLNANGNIVVPEVNIFDPGFSADILISARMSGGNEAPAVTTDAIGVATVTFNEDYTEATVNATVSNLSSAFAGAHIHLGFPDENGNVVFDLTPDFNQGRIQSSIQVTREDVARFVNGQYYLNVHTEDFPAGELRGNLSLESAHSFVTLMSSDEEVPANGSEAIGLASLHYTGNTNVLEVRVQTSGLSGPITGIHLHAGDFGENGPVVENLTPFVNGNTVNVKLDAGDYIDLLRNDSIYLNVHTALYPGGEIRGNFFQIEGLAFDTWLSGGQEVPSIDNGAFGFALGFVNSSLDSMNVAVLADNLSDTLTGAHFHTGPLNMNGPVAINLTDDIEGNLIVNDEPIAVTSDVLASFLTGELYINLHTSTYPGGELRGQVYRIARDGYAYDLCQEQEVHTVSGAGPASGSGMLAFNRDYDEMHVMVVANELSSEFQGAHIHNAAEGADGPVVFNMTDRWSNNGTFFYVTDEFTSDLAQQVQSGNAYVNVHTELNPAGEIRGQVVKMPDCPLITDVVQVNEETLEVEIFPNPTTDVLTLTLEGSEDLYDNAKVVISDLNGKVISQHQLKGNTQRIVTQDLPGGIYMLTILGERFTHTLSFTKANR